MEEAVGDDLDCILEGLETNDQSEVDENLNGLDEDLIDGDLADDLRLNDTYRQIKSELEDYPLEDIPEERRQSMIKTLDYHLQRDADLTDFLD